jgi:chromosome segregation ATPase
MEREFEEKRPELEARLQELVAERERLEEESRNLASAAVEAKTGRQAFYARLGEVHVALETKEVEEARLRAELKALDGREVDREELRRSIEEFDELWEELFPAERARMLGLMVEGVEYEASTEAVRLRFRDAMLRGGSWR